MHIQFQLQSYRKLNKINKQWKMGEKIDSTFTKIRVFQLRPNSINENKVELHISITNKPFRNIKQNYWTQ